VIWKLATSSKKEKGRRPGKIDDLVLLIGAADMALASASYVEHGHHSQAELLGSVR